MSSALPDCTINVRAPGEAFNCEKKKKPRFLSGLSQRSGGEGVCSIKSEKTALRDSIHLSITLDLRPLCSFQQSSALPRVPSDCQQVYQERNRR